ncbi:MAG: c-type cytochrome domain-containing protein, partial [Gemmataceae bacterium]
MRTLLALLVPVVLLVSVGPLRGADQPQASYQQAAAILKKYCAGCHNDAEPAGEFSLESYASLSKGTPKGPALLAGDTEGSRLIRVMVGTSKPQMPPKRKPQPKPEEIELLKAWIASGAKGPDGKHPDPLAIVAPKIKPLTDQRPITALDLSPDEKLLAVASFSKVSVYDVSSAGPLQQNKPGRVFERFPGKVTSVHFTSDSRSLITASGVAGVGGEATIWNVADGKQIKQFKGHGDLLYDAELSPAGKLLATCSYDRTIKIWNAESGELLRTLAGHNGAVYDIAFSPDGRFLVSASADDTCKVWRVSDGLRLDTLGEPLKEVYTCTFTPDGRHIVAGGADNNIRVWEFTSREKEGINRMVVARFAHQGAIVRLGFSADGKRLVSSAEDRTIKVWDTTDYRELQLTKGEPEVAVGLAVAADGQSYVIGRLDGSLARHKINAVAEQPVAEPVKPTVTPIPPRAPAQTAEVEPNDHSQQAQEVKLPVQITGTISGRKDGQPDSDVFRFTARAGQQWVLEVNAGRSKSKLDSFIEILDDKGERVPRVVLQAVRDSYFTFRGKDSDTSDDFRLFNWKEMHLNDYLYANGEVVKLWHYPRGPDSGFKVYPGQGKRRGVFDTTPLTHALGEPCYIVKPFPPKARLTPNGLPTFTLYYQNDDDAERELGSDSRLFFEVPADGTYLVRIRDVRGFEGTDFKYTLTIRPRQPDFRIRLIGTDPVVGAGSASEFTVKADRIDGFDGPIRVEVTGLPPGF